MAVIIRVFTTRFGLYSSINNEYHSSLQEYINTNCTCSRTLYSHKHILKHTHTHTRSYNAPHTRMRACTHTWNTHTNIHIYLHNTHIHTHIAYIHQFVAGSEGFCQMNYICMSHEEHKSRRPAWLWLCKWFTIEIIQDSEIRFSVLISAHIHACLI